MEGILKVTPEQLISTASEFSASGTHVSTLTSEMVNKVTALTNVWEGDAATTYITRFKGLEDDIQLMIRMIQEHATDLEAMAQAYQHAETQNMDEFSALSSDVIQ